MKSKHDVKYIIAATTFALSISGTVTAAEATSEDQIQPIAFVESTDKVEIPVLAEPKVMPETINDEEKIEQVTTESNSLVTSEPSEPMPVAENKDNSYIPLLENAIIFANFDDELPAITNYYTSASEQEVIDFYQQAFGDAMSQDRKRGRLTLTYQADDLVKRVVISEQNNKRQVDVIVEKATQ